MAVAGWEPHKAIKSGRVLRGWTQTDLADRMSQLLGTHWTRDIIASVEAGKRTVDPKELVAFVVLLDLDYDFMLAGVESGLRKLAQSKGLVFAESNSVIPGYTRPGSREARWIADILNSGRGIDHEPGGCVGCLLDRNFHVIGDVRDEIPGQTEIVIDIDRLEVA